MCQSSTNLGPPTVLNVQSCYFLCQNAMCDLHIEMSVHVWHLYVKQDDSGTNSSVTVPNKKIYSIVNKLRFTGLLLDKNELNQNMKCLLKTNSIKSMLGLNIPPIKIPQMPCTGDGGIIYTTITRNGCSLSCCLFLYLTPLQTTALVQSILTSKQFISAIM